MRKNLSVLLVGVLIGGLLFLAYPTTAATTSKRLKRLENKVETLQKKTRFMTRRGDYFGFIVGEQVVSVCNAGTPAHWFDEMNDTTILDSCFAPSTSAKELRHRLGQR
jgi:hypothetical protein